MRALHLTHVQLDELRVKLRGAAEAAWLPLALRLPVARTRSLRRAGQTTGWVACDTTTKIIPAFTLGPRTQALAHQLVHEVASCLAPGCLPVFSSDGLALYFYALSAHFGEWVQTEGERRRSWVVSAQLLYAQVVKRYSRRRITVVRHQVLLGKPDAYHQALGRHGFSGRIQTAFIERLNLTIRRSIAGLARRSWSTAHSLGELTLQFEWWRAVYHLTRPHHSLRQPLRTSPAQPTRQRFRPRTTAQAAGLTSRRWTILQVLSYPAPPLASG
jgi:IS1 family transposase